MSVSPALISNRLQSSPGSFPFALSSLWLPLLSLLLLFLLARRSPRLHAFDCCCHLGQTLIRQSFQRRKSGAQQLALFDGYPQQQTSPLEDRDQRVIGGGHREAVANYLAQPRARRARRPLDRRGGACPHSG